MRVLMFGWEFPPHISGGLGTACYGLAKGLAQNDVDILFVIPKSFGDEDTSMIRLVGASDIPVSIHSSTYELLQQRFTMLNVNSLIVPYLTAEEFQRYTEEQEHTTTTVQRWDSTFTTRFDFTGKYGRDLMAEVYRYAIVATEIAGENTFDIIHAHDWLSYPAGIAAKEATHKPLIVHVHATEFDRSGDHINPDVFNIEREGMIAADKIIAVSEFTRQTVIRKYGISPDKVVAIHNAVEQYSEKEEQEEKGNFKEKIVSYLGRVTFQKGPEYFIEAANKVLQRDKGYRFVMAGSGDMLHRMIKKVAELRISSHFHFTGFLKGKDVDKMFAMSDVYVMPSVSEPFGISPLEAIRSNVPVIISKQSGVREVLKNSIQIDFWDTDAMANAIYALTHYKGLSKTFVRNGKQEIGQLQWQTQAKKIKELYEQFIKG